jgi:tetratricopeptide (TPR) repeat protein
MRYKYNPSFYQTDELIKAFVVRQQHLTRILEQLRESPSGDQRHLLVIGPRGSGKTTLVLRVGAEIDRDTALKSHWLPIIFAEESYEVLSPGELWLQALVRLEDESRDPRLANVVTELRLEPDDVRLSRAAVCELLAYSEKLDKQILLVVENIDMLLTAMEPREIETGILDVLRNHKSITLLGTATATADSPEFLHRRWSDILSIEKLGPLDQDECAVLWKSLTGDALTSGQLRAIQILSGGNVRLVKILGDFAFKTSFRELMNRLSSLVDQHTGYFKSQLEHLAPAERKVFVAVLNIWDPADARTVGQMTRMGTSKASALLNRLESKGAVTAANDNGKSHLYQATERLFNIYYLMRKGGHPSNRVRAVVKFMVQFYDGDRLIRTIARLASEACLLTPEWRRDHYVLYEEVVKQIPEAELKSQILRATPKEFFQAPDMPDSIRQWLIVGESSDAKQSTSLKSSSRKSGGPTSAQPTESSLLQRAFKLEKNPKKLHEAERLYRKAIEIAPSSPRPWTFLGILLAGGLQRPGDAERAYRKALELDPHNSFALSELGRLLSKEPTRMDEAQQLFMKAVEAKPDYVWGWCQLGRLAHMRKDHAAAERAYRKALEIDPDYHFAWFMLALLLDESSQRLVETESAYRKVVQLKPDFSYGWICLANFLRKKLGHLDEALHILRKQAKNNNNKEAATAWLGLGELYEFNLKRPMEAENAYRRAIELDGSDVSPLAMLGRLLEELGRYEEAVQVCRKLIELKPGDDFWWITLGHLYEDSLHSFDDAETAFRTAVDLNVSPHGLAHLGRLYATQKGMPIEAEQFLRRAIAASPEDRFALGTLETLLNENGRSSEAEELYRRTLESNPKNAWIWYDLGNLLWSKLGRVEEAVEVFRRAVEIDPHVEGAWAHLGYLLKEKLGRSAEAIDACRRASELNPNSGHLLFHYGEVLGEEEGRAHEAESILKRAIALKFDYAPAWDALAHVLMKMHGREGEAEEASLKALELEASRATAWQSILRSALHRNESDETIVRKVDIFLQTSARATHVLNSIAQILCSASSDTLLTKAEELALEALKNGTEQNWSAAHTLSRVYAAKNQWSEALRLSADFVTAAATDESALKASMDFLVSAAAAGHGSETLCRLTEMQATGLEPLQIGIQLYLGQGAPRAAQEIMEIARDVAERIRRQAASDAAPAVLRDPVSQASTA